MCYNNLQQRVTMTVLPAVQIYGPMQSMYVVGQNSSDVQRVFCWIYFVDYRPFYRVFCLILHSAGHSRRDCGNPRRHQSQLHRDSSSRRTRGYCYWKCSCLTVCRVFSEP